jgi:hypothetical protein
MGITYLNNEGMAPGPRGNEGETRHSDRIQNMCSPVKVQAVHGLQKWSDLYGYGGGCGRAEMRAGREREPCMTNSTCRKGPTGAY